MYLSKKTACIQKKHKKRSTRSMTARRSDAPPDGVRISKPSSTLRKPLKVVVIGTVSVGKTSILRQFVHHNFDPRSTMPTIGCDFWHQLLEVPPEEAVGAATTTSVSGGARAPNGGASESSAATSPVRAPRPTVAADDAASSASSSATTAASLAPSSLPPRSPSRAASTASGMPSQVQLQVWDTAGQEHFQALAPRFFRGADGGMLVYDLTNPQSLTGLQKWRDLFVTHAGDDVPMLIVGNKLDLVADRRVSRDTVEAFVRESVSGPSSSSSGGDGGVDGRLGAAQGQDSIATRVSAGLRPQPGAIAGAVELTAADGAAVGAAFVRLTHAMLRRERAIQERMRRDASGPAGGGAGGNGDGGRVRLAPRSQQQGQQGQQQAVPPKKKCDC
jgi:small GTP-binding protein